MHLLEDDLTLKVHEVSYSLRLQLLLCIMFPSGVQREAGRGGGNSKRYLPITEAPDVRAISKNTLTYCTAEGGLQSTL